MNFDFLIYKQREYTNQQGNVRYLDGKRLLRPLDVPMVGRVIIGVLVVVAVVIGAQIYQNTAGAMSSAAQKNTATVEENIARQVSYDLPVLTGLAGLDDATILTLFTNAGYTMYNQTAEGATGLDIIKLPSDVDMATAASMYAKGVSSLSASDAAKLLKGSWTFSSDRSSGETLSVKYVDFSAASLEAAIGAAIVTEGFDAATTPEDGKGTDSVGNTYQTGTVDVNGVVYNWRISATALSNVYSITGLPESAIYVGIRITAQ